MNKCRLCLWLVACLTLVTARAWAAVTDTRDTSAEQCAYAVAYSAPPTCPDVQELQSKLDAGYRVQRGSLAECEDCVRGILIEEDKQTRGYRLEIAGLESTTVTRQDCRELAEFAIYAIEASDLPAPECTRTSVSVGVSATPLMNLSNGDPLVATQVRLTLPLGGAEITPFGFWMPESQVSNQVASNGRNLNPDWQYLSLGSYGAGLDACLPLVTGLLGNDNVFSMCGVGMWRRFTARHSAGNAESDAELWTVGGALSFRVGLFETVHLEIAPSVLVGLGDAATYAVGTGERLYQYGGVEAQLRVGLTWDFIVRRSFSNKPSPRTASVTASTSAQLQTRRVSTGRLSTGRSQPTEQTGWRM